VARDPNTVVECPFCKGETGTFGYEGEWSECSECDETGRMTITAVHDLNSWWGSFEADGSNMETYERLKAEPIPDWIAELPAAAQSEGATHHG
jgi:hypothetical protein